MLSICIPIYNYDVSLLVAQLSAQIDALKESIEIILIDDGSDHVFKHENENSCKAHTYIELSQNIGRSAIRNSFLERATFDHLLFLDCDSLVEHPEFLTNYIKAIKQSPDKVLCGGRLYPIATPAVQFLLRWKYGIEKESKPAIERSKLPNRSFMTNNFVVSKAILTAIRFDERLKNYGHEDTLFGFELKENDIEVVHLENPIVNGHLETNEAYLDNTEKAVKNLIHILAFTNYNRELIDDVSLLRAYYKIKFLSPLLIIAFKTVKKPIRKRLSQGKVSLWQFDFYKLGLLALHLRQNSQKSV